MPTENIDPGPSSSAAVRFPYVFVVGCQRSGTTLLQRLLDNHPELAVTNDAQFISKGLRNEVPATDPQLTADMVIRVRDYHRFSRLGLTDEKVIEAATAASTYGDFVHRLYVAVARQRGKRLVGDKSPQYSLQMPLLDRLFPDARYVHLIRDGRDNALAFIDWAEKGHGPARHYELWSEEPVAVSAMWWARRVGTARRDGAKLGPHRYLELHYEDLVTQPAEILETITDFLELEYSPEMLRFHEKKKSWKPVTPRLRNWRETLPERELMLFEALAGDLLDELAYPRGASQIPAEIHSTASRCQRWWDARRDASPGSSVGA